MNIIQKWPGLATIASLGRARVNLRRAWQKEETVFVPERCPLCTETASLLVREAGEWQVVRCLYPLYDYHMLLLPKRCVPARQPHVALGGEEMIRAALRISLQEAEAGRDYWLGANVGGFAGQSIPHLHYHFIRQDGAVKTRRTADLLREAVGSSAWIIEGKGWRIAAGGHRPGQCLIFPADQQFLSPEECARAIQEIVLLAEKKFDAPEYQVAVALGEGGLCYATFVPILSQLGAMNALALLEGREFPLQWPHESTADFLRERTD